MGLVESGPADPHVEEREPSESAGHALIGALLRGVACACTSVDGEKEGGDEGDGGEDRRTHGELLELLGNHCEAIKCQSQINLIKNYLTSITRKDRLNFSLQTLLAMLKLSRLHSLSPFNV